jgi:hypothetical protein
MRGSGRSTAVECFPSTAANGKRTVFFTGHADFEIDDDDFCRDMSRLWVPGSSGDRRAKLRRGTRMLSTPVLMETN